MDAMTRKPGIQMMDEFEIQDFFSNIKKMPFLDFSIAHLIISAEKLVLQYGVSGNEEMSRLRILAVDLPRQSLQTDPSNALVQKFLDEEIMFV